jgi:hypothetical protein
MARLECRFASVIHVFDPNSLKTRMPATRVAGSWDGEPGSAEVRGVLAVRCVNKGELHAETRDWRAVRVAFSPYAD